MPQSRFACRPQSLRSSLDQLPQCASLLTRLSERHKSRKEFDTVLIAETRLTSSRALVRAESPQ
jgi:hypothetical protein